VVATGQKEVSITRETVHPRACSWSLLQFEITSSSSFGRTAKPASHTYVYARNSTRFVSRPESTKLNYNPQDVKPTKCFATLTHRLPSDHIHNQLPTNQRPTKVHANIQCFSAIHFKLLIYYYFHYRSLKKQTSYQ
jgi:hypothetical protein